MSCFVAEPNLPKTCSALIYGEKYASRLRKAIDLLHIESLFVPDNPDIDQRLSGHADLSILHAGGERLFLAPYLKGSSFSVQLQKRGAQIVFPVSRQGSTYPRDAQFNCCLIGNHVICNSKTVSLEIANYLTKVKRRQMISCRQGYTRCAACVVDADSIITADRGIAAAAQAGGVQVLFIRPGFIHLDGFAYGFIGGASFKPAPDRLAFTGCLDAHPDRDAILHFLSQRDVEPVFLGREPAFDIGSAIPIFEN